MSTFKTSNSFDVSLERFVTFSNEPALLDYLANAGNMAKRQVYGREEDEHTIKWKVSLAVDENVPSALRKLVGKGQLQWTNAFVMNKDTRKLSFTVVDSVFERLFDVRGDVDLVATGAYATRMDLVINLKSKVPLLGRSLDGFLSDKVLEGWARDAACRAEYMALRMAQLAKEGELDPAEMAKWGSQSA